MTDQARATTEPKGPLQHAVDLLVRLPVEVVLDLPRTVPRYLARSRDVLTHPDESLELLQAHAHRTLRALGIGTTSDEARGPLPDELGAIHDHSDGHRTTDGTDGRDRGDALPTEPPPIPSGSPVVAGATVVAGIARRAPVVEVRAPRPPEPAPAPAPVEPVPTDAADPDGLAIPGYDSLSASQVVPRLESLSADELDQVRRYELANRGRKTILSKIAQLQA